MPKRRSAPLRPLRQLQLLRLAASPTLCWRDHGMIKKKGVSNHHMDMIIDQTSDNQDRNCGRQSEVRMTPNFVIAESYSRRFKTYAKQKAGWGIISTLPTKIWLRPRSAIRSEITQKVLTSEKKNTPLGKRLRRGHSPYWNHKNRLGLKFDFTYKNLAKSQKWHKRLNNSKSIDFRKEKPFVKSY